MLYSHSNIKTKHTEREVNITVVKNIDCFNVIGSLNTLIQKELPIKGAMQMRKMVKQVDEHITVVREEINACLEKYAEKEKDGNIKYDKDNNPVIPADKQLEFDKRYQEILDCEWEGAPLIDVDSLGDIKVTTSLILTLEPFIKE